MNTLDIILLVVTLGSLFLGFRKGLISQVGSVGGIVAGVLLCRMAGGRMTEVVTSWGIIGDGAAGLSDTDAYLTRMLAGVILFIGGFVAVRVVAHFCRALTHALCLGFLDRIAGALFCLAEWLLVMSLMLNFWTVIKPQTDWGALSTLGNGHAIEFVLALAPKLLGWAVA